MSLAWSSLSIIHSNQSGYRSGQTLLEFLIVVPILITLLFTAFWFGSAFYSASNASNAVKQPQLERMNYAAKDEGVNPAQVLSGIQGTNTAGSLNTTNTQQPLTTLRGVNLDGNTNTGLLIGKKTFQSPYVGLPNLTFGVFQVMDGNLFTPNNGPAHSNNTFAASSIFLRPQIFGFANVDEDLQFHDKFCNPGGTISLAQALQITPTGMWESIGDFEAPISTPITWDNGYSQPHYIQQGQVLTWTARANTICEAASDKYYNSCRASYFNHFWGIRKNSCRPLCRTIKAKTYAESAAYASNNCTAQKITACKLQLANEYFNQLVRYMQQNGACASTEVFNNSGITTALGRAY